MATVVFDFDSTLVRCESLEEIVAPYLDGDPGLRKRYREITDLGMSGDWPFHESLKSRLSIVAPTRADLLGFAARVDQLWTAGMPELVARLHDGGHQVWVVSGGFREAVTPAAERLGIPANRVLAVQLSWTEDGRFAGVDSDDPFSHSKTRGVRERAPRWPAPRVMVGDGRTDRALYDEGLVDHFIPFTQHARRPAAIPEGVEEADSVDALQRILEGHLSP